MILLYWRQIIFYSFALVAAVQLFYYFYFFLRLALYKKPAAKPASRTHPVSVIICARDEAANLAKNLPGVLIQQYPTTHEVIVVNDNSFDESKYLLEEYQRRYKQLHVIELKQEAKFIPGKKFPLSIGIKTAKHEVLLLTDADCVPASEWWIQKMQEAYDNDDAEIVLGYGAYHKKHGLLNKVVRWETFHTALQYFSYTLAGYPYMGVGRNLSYKKALFYKHKGFTAHNHLPSGDDDLFINAAATKTNTRINLDPDTFTLSEPSKTWAQWRKQKKRHMSAGKYYKPFHKFLLGVYFVSHFLFYPLLTASMVCFDWRWSLIVFGVRFITQALVLHPCFKRLHEKDLYPLFLFFDIWMFFYYLVFAPVLIKKPKSSWK